MKTAIITGVSSGLGREYLKVLCEKQEIESIWIIARREQRLYSLAGKYPYRNIVCLPFDITKESSVEKLAKKLKRDKPEILYLINNAGIGKIGKFITSDKASQTDMIALNCLALTAVTSVVLPYMIKGSSVINVCSVASFAPTPNMTVYSSTKAYIMSFSRGLGFELKNRGIKVSAVCPGPMRTEFLSVAGIESGVSKAFDTLPYSSPKTVAKKSVEAADRGYSVYTPGIFYKFYRGLAKLLPHSIVMYISKT